MMRSPTALLTALVLATGCGAGPVSSHRPPGPAAITDQAEALESHADKPNRIVTITPTRVVPVELHMGTGDVLAFHNLSGDAVVITFIQPKNVGRHTKCKLVRRISPTEAVAPGAVFQAQGDQVTATLLPGTFVSICSLDPGTYVYTANLGYAGGIPNDATLGMKGTVVVE